MMKPTAILVNMSHRPLVDDAAVIGALHTGAIGGAAIDVYDDSRCRRTARCLAVPTY